LKRAYDNFRKTLTPHQGARALSMNKNLRRIVELMFS